MAATPAPMECPVMMNSNPGFSNSASAHAESCVLRTWYALITMPACANPPANGAASLHASVRRSDALTVPLIARTTARSARSTATYDAGEKASVTQSALTKSDASTPAERAAAAVASALAASAEAPLVHAARTAVARPRALSFMLLFWRIAAREPYAAAA